MTTAVMGTLMFAVAMLYAVVGHAGASGYLAVMGLFGTDATIMKPIALTLNILVATVGTCKFHRAGHFSWKLFWPFAVTSIPFAFLGGTLTLPTNVYKVLVGLVLLYSAYRLFVTAKSAEERTIVPPPLWAALLLGAVIGLLSGLTGVGGGIFLSPLILLMGWAGMKQTSAVAVTFILVNSIAGLLGHWSSAASLPPQILYWGAAVLVGGWIGAEVGSKRLANVPIRKVLAVVLALAGLKMTLAVI